MPAVVRLRSAVCLLGRFPALAGADLDVDDGRDRAALGRERRGQDHAAAALRGPGAAVLGRGDGARPRPRVDRTGARRDSRSSATRPSATTTSPCARTCGSRPAPSGAADADADAALERLGLDPSGRRRARPPLGGAAPPPRARDRARRATRGCCCSTSRTPGSTRRAARLLDDVVRAAPAEGRTVLLASHELELARAARDPRGRDRRRPGRDSTARRSDAAPRAGARRAHDALARGPRSWRGQGPAHRGADRASRCSRSSRSAASCCCCSRSRSTPTAASCAGSRPACSGSRCCWPRCSRSSRSFAIEDDNGARDGLRLSGLDGGAHLPRQGRRDRGRAARARGRARRRRGGRSTASSCNALVPLILATLAATVGLAATGTVYGVLAAGLRVRETLRAAARAAGGHAGDARRHPAFEAALDGVPSDAWPWVAAARRCSRCSFTAIGMLAFGPLLEEA